MNKKTNDKIRKVLESELNLDLSNIGDDELLLGGKIVFDSIVSLRIVISMEEAFNISIDDDDICDNFFESIENMEKVIESYL